MKGLTAVKTLNSFILPFRHFRLILCESQV